MPLKCSNNPPCFCLIKTSPRIRSLLFFIRALSAKVCHPNLENFVWRHHVCALLRSTNMAAEEEWYFEEEGCLQFSGRPVSVTFSPASNCFICTLEDGTIEVVDARSSLRLKRTSTAGQYDEMKHVILI